MRVIVASDVFPPFGKGGAAWSSHALARALIGRGHAVSAVVPVRGARGATAFDALGVPAVRVGYFAPPVPIVQNLFRHELLWRRLARAIVAEARRGPPPDAIHAQHVQVAPAAVIAGRELGVPVVVTVRDHWPWDYFATGLHGDRIPLSRPGWPALATDLVARLGPLKGAAALPAVPYMLAHLRRRAAALAQADAVIAVSGYVAGRLIAAGFPRRVHVLPNMVDIAAAEAVAAQPPASTWQGALLLFAGKLEPNKGAGLLPAIFRELRALQLPAPPAAAASCNLQSAICNPQPPPFTLLVAGDGAMRPQLERELAALGVPARFLDWASHDETLRLMARCDLLLFPSAWGEPLSRVLLEAASLGAPILAMPTGGTPDIVQDGATGALAPTPRLFAARLQALLAAPAERRRLGDNARAHARERFSVDANIGHYEALYEGLGPART